MLRLRVAEIVGRLAHQPAQRRGEQVPRHQATGGVEGAIERLAKFVRQAGRQGQRQGQRGDQDDVANLGPDAAAGQQQADGKDRQPDSPGQDVKSSPVGDRDAQQRARAQALERDLVTQFLQVDRQAADAFERPVLGVPYRPAALGYLTPGGRPLRNGRCGRLIGGLSRVRLGSGRRHACRRVRLGRHRWHLGRRRRRLGLRRGEGVGRFRRFRQLFFGLQRHRGLRRRRLGGTRGGPVLDVVGQVRGVAAALERHRRSACMHSDGLPRRVHASAQQVQASQGIPDRRNARGQLLGVHGAAGPDQAIALGQDQLPGDIGRRHFAGLGVAVGAQPQRGGLTRDSVEQCKRVHFGLVNHLQVADRVLDAGGQVHQQPIPVALRGHRLAVQIGRPEFRSGRQADFQERRLGPQLVPGAGQGHAAGRQHRVQLGALDDGRRQAVTGPAVDIDLDRLRRPDGLEHPQQAFAHRILGGDQFAHIDRPGLCPDDDVQLGIAFHGDDRGLVGDVLGADQGQRQVFPGLVRQRLLKIDGQSHDSAGRFGQQGCPAPDVARFLAGELLDRCPFGAADRQRRRRILGQLQGELADAGLANVVQEFVVGRKPLGRDPQERVAAGRHGRLHARDDDLGRIRLGVVPVGQAELDAG